MMRSILRIDMGAAGGPTASLGVLGPYAGLSGRALVTRILAGEVDRACRPSAAANRLVVAPGPRGASAGSARLVAIGCASPLSGGVVVSGAAAPAADALRRLGYAAIVVEGRAAAGDLWKVVIDRSGVSFASAAALRGLGNLDAFAALRRAHGSTAAFLGIGPAGEARLAAASVSASASGAEAVRACGHGGAGAVMGAKRIKAFVVDAHAAADGRAAKAPDRLADDDLAPYREACGIEDRAILAELRRLDGDLGVERGEVARAVGVAMQAGLARAGDGRAALRLVAEIGRGTPLGRILGSGARAARNALGLAVELPATNVFGLPEEDLVRLVDALEERTPLLADAPPGTRLPAGFRLGRGVHRRGGPSDKN